MPKLQWKEFYQRAKRGEFCGGDIFFVSASSGVGKPHQHIIKFGQHIRAFQYKDHGNYDPHVYHAGFFAEHVSPQGKILTICQSEPPQTKEIPLDRFLSENINREFIVFRAHSVEMSALINLFCHHYTNQPMPYTSYTKLLGTLAPIYSRTNQSPPPDKINCATFVAFVFNTALFKLQSENPRYKPITPFNYTQVSPMHLYRSMFEKTQYEGSLHQI